MDHESAAREEDRVVTPGARTLHAGGILFPFWTRPGDVLLMGKLTKEQACLKLPTSLSGG